MTRRRVYDAAVDQARDMEPKPDPFAHRPLTDDERSRYHRELGEQRADLRAWKRESRERNRRD